MGWSLGLPCHRGRAFSLPYDKDFSFSCLVLLVLVLLFVFHVRLTVHSCSSISRCHYCIEDFVEFNNRLWVLGSKLLHSTLIIAPLLEGHDHPIFTHVRDRVMNLAKSMDKIPKMLIGFLNTCQHIILVARMAIGSMKVGFE